jgi:predicted ATP-dependent serine protease
VRPTATAALISSFSGVALPTDCVYFGEASLSEAIRTVGQTPRRKHPSALAVPFDGAAQGARF